MKINCRIGCAGLLTDIPLMVALAKGFFPDDEVHVSLTEELGWASMELKLATGHLAAANVPPSFPLLLSLKKGVGTQAMHALSITAYHGEALTLNLKTAAVFQGGKPGVLKSLRIGVDAPYSLSPLFAQAWLKTMRLEQNASIQLVPLAISQLLDLLKDGYIQGFCCAEPMSQIAAGAEIGTTVARSRDHPPLHIQSVLAASESFCSAHPGAAKAIASAVEKARIFCANPKNEAEIIRIYRKQKPGKQNPSALSHNGPSQLTPLSALIGFEAGPSVASAKETFGYLVPACLSLGGVTAGEREIRDAIKRIFSSVH